MPELVIGFILIKLASAPTRYIVNFGSAGIYGILAMYEAYQTDKYQNVQAQKSSYDVYWFVISNE